MAAPDHIDTYQPEIYYEPLFVCLPPESTKKQSTQVFDRHDFNMNRNYKPHLMDKSAVVSDSESDVRPPIPPRRPITDSKLFRVSDMSSKSRPTGVSQFSDTKLKSQHSSFDNDHFPYIKNRRSVSTSMSGISYVSSEEVSLSQSDAVCQNRSREKKKENDYPQSSNLDFFSKGKQNHQQKTYEPIRDHFATARSRDRPHLPQVFHEAKVVSASKRRKGNDKVVLPINSNQQQRTLRSARQRLLFTSPARSRDADTTMDPTMPPIKTQQTPPLNKFYENRKKISHLTSKTSNIGSSSRKPLTELNNIHFSKFDAHNTCTESTDEVSPKYLPSRTEELLDRDAYYCDFTVDRQHKIDDFFSGRTMAPSSNEDNDSQNTNDDTASSETLTRKVEGAESSPSSFVFRAPPSNLRAPRAVVRGTWQKTHKFKLVNEKLRSRPSLLGDTGDGTNVPSKVRSGSSNSGSQDHPHFSSSSSNSYNPPDTRSTSPSSRSSSRSSSKSSRSSAQKLTSHPMASSTLLDSSSTSLLREPASSHKKLNIHLNLDRPPVLDGRDRSTTASSTIKHRHTSEIAGIVSHFSEQKSSSKPNNKNGNIILRYSSARSDLQATTSRCVNNASSDRCVVAAAHSFLKNMNNGSHQCSEISSQSSNQVTTSSTALNNARASIVCTSNESSDVPDDGRVSYEVSHYKHISASEPNLLFNYFTDSKGGTYSLVPSDTDTTEDSSGFEDRPEIPGKSSTSSSSSCTAARCRPRFGANRSPDKLSEAAALSEVPTFPPQRSSLPDQDLLDSILTNSPNSVDSSGIYAPHNSYNSPIESVGSHNGYSSTVSSSVSSESNYNLPRRGLAAIPLRTRSVDKKNYVTKFLAKTDKANDNVEFKRPFTPSPYIDRTAKRSTRNQGVTADSTPSTPHRPMSVWSDPLSRRSVFAVPPGVITGPPKIKNKNSLVRKLKKFSSHFYKKTEKIQTLANL